MSTAEKVARARALLREGGVAAEVEAAGFQDDIAAVRAGAGALAQVAALAESIRALGFRYVALELEPASDER